MPISQPPLIEVPFAESGLKNAIPANANNITGNAGFDLGFPPINLTAVAAGGIPPYGQDMNGILYAITECLRFFQAGSIYTYDAPFSTAIGGYRAGARVQRTDGTGYWLNTVDGNTNDPEAAGAATAGWVPDFTYGAAAITMNSSNVTLTEAQYGKPFIVITGTLTANLSLIFPNIYGEWIIFDNTSGAFTITCKTSAGTGVATNKGTPTNISGDSVNIYGGIPSASETVAGVIEIANSPELTTGTDNTRAVTPAGIRTSLNATGSAPIYACRAWVRTSNTTGTIGASGNVSSVGNSATGRFTVNFTVALPDANYAYSFTPKALGAFSVADIVSAQHNSIAPTASSCDFMVRGMTSFNGQNAEFSAAFFR